MSIRGQLVDVDPDAGNWSCSGARCVCPIRCWPSRCRPCLVGRAPPLHTQPASRFTTLGFRLSKEGVGGLIYSCAITTDSCDHSVQPTIDDLFTRHQYIRHVDLMMWKCRGEGERWRPIVRDEIMRRFNYDDGSVCGRQYPDRQESGTPRTNEHHFSSQQTTELKRVSSRGSVSKHDRSRRSVGEYDWNRHLRQYET